MDPYNVDNNIAIDLFIFNLSKNGSIEVMKCGKIFPTIEASGAEKVKNSTQNNNCIKIERLPLSVVSIPGGVSVNGSVSETLCLGRELIGVIENQAGSCCKIVSLKNLCHMKLRCLC